MIESFNGLKELSQRKDGIKELTEFYKHFPILTQLPKQYSIDYLIPHKLPFLELLLSNDIFVKQLDTQSAIELKKVVLEKYEGKVNNLHVYSLYNIKKTFLLGAVVMNHTKSEKSSQQEKIVKKFIKNYKNADATLLMEISKIISDL